MPVHVEWYDEPWASEDLTQLQLNLFNNLTLCYLKKERWPDARDCARDVITVDPDNVKALYRRAQANIGLLNYDEALPDLKHAAKLDPEDKSVARSLAVCAKAAKKEAARAKKTFGAMFA